MDVDERQSGEYNVESGAHNGRYLRRRGLMANTRRAYLGVLGRALPNPIDWYGKLLAQRAPIGTTQQARTAIAHWLRMRGDSEAQIRGTLAPARGRKGNERRGLSKSELQTFLAAADEQNEPIRTLLLLLPRTGLRISELCGLTFDTVLVRENRHFLRFRGKGDKLRTVPLGPEGVTVLCTWMESRSAPVTPQEPLFLGKGADAIRPWSVQQACRDIRAQEPSLGKLTPHVLRHTYATQAVVAGVDLASLKALLGHDDITTTQRYLHPSDEDLAASVDGIPGT